MNYLILTPDGVGSTILQRLITITLYLEKVPVMNTHELTNGLVLKNGIATKDFTLNYTQSLDQITDILRTSANETILVGRLTKYHIDSRKDSIKDQKNFFNFLNQFYNKKIMCVRENLFEYAMSWSIRDKSGVTNVYNREDRKKVLQVSHVDEDYFLQKCKEYVAYYSWVEKYFTNLEIVSYESILKNGDLILEKLTGYKNTFTNNFGISLSSILKKEYDLFGSLVKNSGNELSKQEKKSLIKYKQLSQDLMKRNIILGTPIKNTTLKDKMHQIKNFNQCLDKFYSFAKNYNWIDQSTATYDFWNEEQIC